MPIKVCNRLLVPIIAFDQLAAQRFEAFEGAAFVGADQPRIARDIGREDRGEAADLAHWCTLACEYITAYAVMYSRPGVFRDGPSGSPLDGPHETRRAEGAGRLRRATG